MKSVLFSVVLACVTLLLGCAGYTWGTSVPKEYRKVFVPVFENLTNVSELGPIVTQYTLREFQREGSFRIVRSDDAAIEVQGVLRTTKRETLDYDRGQSMRASEYRYVVTADVLFIDKKSGKILFERKGLQGETTYLTQDDFLTGQKNASFRIASDIARQIVNDALALPLAGNGTRSGAVEGVQK